MRDSNEIKRYYQIQESVIPLTACDSDCDKVINLINLLLNIRVSINLMQCIYIIYIYIFKNLCLHIKSQFYRI